MVMFCDTTYVSSKTFHIYVFIWRHMWWIMLILKKLDSHTNVGQDRYWAVRTSTAKYQTKFVRRPTHRVYYNVNKAMLNTESEW